MTTPAPAQTEFQRSRFRSPLSPDAANLPWTSDPNSHAAAVFTFMLWSICLAIGLLGFLLPYQRPPSPPPPEPPILAQQLQVELTSDPIPPAELEPVPPDRLTPPPQPDAFTPPAIIEPIAVAQPDPTIAFPLPVETAAPVVEAKRADYSIRPTNNAAATPPAAQPLVFGQGEGKQPDPEYPPVARRLGQEGTVVVRLTVGPNGRVLAAEALLPSPWPLLNEAALRAVRQRWRFRSGPLRLYQVAIRFEIVK